VNPNLSVANRFFGIAANGDHKIRGVASRRGDTCTFIANIQRQVIQILANEQDSTKLVDRLPEILTFVQDQLSAMKNGTVSLEELVVSQDLSRELDGYSVLSPLAVAAHQLRAQGKTIRMGMRIRYLYVARGPGVHAWDLPNAPDWKAIDRTQYRKLIMRAVQEVLQPLGVTDAILKNWLIGQVGYLAPPGFLKTTNPTRLALPLLADLKYLRVD
jgi:DNA polymerase elongation subunit (family B)